ncbi:dihydrofolate reductase [Bacillaceae bacterium W0354]
MLSVIVAMDENNVIGYQNDLPWHLPNDLKRFKRITTGHTIVMGRKTYESIGRPLPNRQNIIMTRDSHFTAEGCTVIHSWEELNQYLNDEELFLIGGAELIKQAIPIVDRLYLTIIHHSFEGDTYFPNLNMDDWEVVEKVEGIVDEKNKYPHTFYTYDRKN